MQGSPDPEAEAPRADDRQDVGRAPAPHEPAPPADRPQSMAAQRAASRTAEERAAARALPAQTDVPGATPAPADSTAERAAPVSAAPIEEVATMSVPAPYPVRAMWALYWPVMGCVLLAAFIVGMFFPVLGLPLLILTPVAVAAAFWLAARRARTIRLDINRDAVRVTNDRTALTTARHEVAGALLVERFHRGPLLPDTTDVFLLDRAGRSLLVLNGLLWPPAVLDRALDVLGPLPVERVQNRHTGATLAARHPGLVRRADGRVVSLGGSRLGLLVVLGVLLVAAVAITLRMLVSG